MSDTSDRRAASELIDRVRTGLAGATARSNVLSAVAWPRAVEERFFAAGATALPDVAYDVDRATARANLATLAALEASLPDGDGDAVPRWLRATVRSFIDANRLTLAVGTAEFHRISTEVYGSARTRLLGDGARNVDLASHMLERLRVRGGDEATDATAAPVTDAAFAAGLRARLAADLPGLAVDVTIDGDCTAKVIAGMSRVRVRRGAVFMPWEVDALWAHEVETHVLTAQNGAAQPTVSFLRAGGPRATRTQEGLAIFAELYSGGLTIDRIERLATRVRLVDMAEQGASFLDLYRHLRDGGHAERDAYLDAQRVCRGGLVAGGAPFTKDTVYLAGLIQVYSFLSVVVRGGLRDEAELLVAGRITLDDLAALAELRHRGLVARPRHLPRWLHEWRRLLPHFAFASFFSQVDLRPVEAHYQHVLEAADAYVPQPDTTPPPSLSPNTSGDDGD